MNRNSAAALRTLTRPSGACSVSHSQVKVTYNGELGGPTLETLLREQRRQVSAALNALLAVSENHGRDLWNLRKRRSSRTGADFPRRAKRDLPSDAIYPTWLVAI